MGFSGSFLLKKKGKEQIKFEEKKITSNLFNFVVHDTNKFYKDCLFFEYKDKIIFLEGVILNNKELQKTYNENNWQNTFKIMLEEGIDNCLEKLRGNFCGFIYDLENLKLILFTDQWNNNRIYYSLRGDNFYFDTRLDRLAKQEKEYNILDEDAAYLLLTFGGTLEKRTLFKNIKKLNYATIFEISISKEIKEKKYFDFDNTPDNSITEEMAIEKIDELFRQAIKREFEKDKEYGYAHMAALSAGRDSRMTVWVASEMGYLENLVTTTFSETGELDETIPKKIAKDLKCEWIFKMLDNGNCMYDIDDIMKRVVGEVSYGTLHGYNMMRDINYNRYGIFHTGQLGDVILSTFGNVDKLNLKKFKYVYSKYFLNKVIDKNILKLDYKNEEIFNYVNRGINVTLVSAILYKNLQEISPFMDIDLLNYCLTIPSEIRDGNRLYDQWIIKKYPQAAKYKHNGRIIGGKEIKILGRVIPIRELIPRILKKLKLLREKKGMNPFDEWYNKNEKFKLIFDNYYKKNIDKLIKYSELKKDCEDLYKNGNVREKAQVLGILATLKNFFI